MNNVTIYIPYCENDINHLIHCLNHLNQYNLNVVLLKTIPNHDILFKVLKGDLKETEFESYSNLNIKHFEYNYYCNTDLYNYEVSTFSFSEIKNLAFKLCESKWILFLDADELLVLDPDFVNWFNSIDLDSINNVGAFNLNVFSYTQLEHSSKCVTNQQQRLIHNNGIIKYENKIHESVYNIIINNNFNILDSANTIIHRGYNNRNILEHKSKRNLGLLASQLKTQLDNYFAQKLLLQIQNYLLQYNIEITSTIAPQLDNVLTSIHLQDITITFNASKLCNELMILLRKVESNNYDLEILRLIYEKLDYLLKLKIV